MIILLCFSGYEKLTRLEKNKICNAAGAADDWKSDYIPNTLYGLDCAEVFNIHDYCYHIGATAEDKEASDYMMLINLLRVIKTGSKILGFFRRRRALMYFEFVDIKGSKSFWKDKVPNEVHVRTRKTITINYAY